MDLSVKQLAFCHEYLMDYNAPRAAVRAGYSPRSIRNASSELMRNPVIRIKIASLMDLQYKHHLVSNEFVIDHLVAIVNEAREPQPVYKWDNKARRYQETGMSQTDTNAALKALVTLGHMLGMFSDFDTRPPKPQATKTTKTPPAQQTHKLRDVLAALDIQMPSFT